LPDGLFSNQKSQFGFIGEGLAMENLGIFYDHLDYFRAIGNILWPFGIFCGNWYIFPRFGILDQEKSGNPDVPFMFWGRCYGHNFLRFFPIFCEKMAFFLNTNVIVKLV
jgi:hypothetical protein